MSSDDTNFLPEQLDQQIEQPVERLAPDDQRLVQDLWHAYQGYEQMNAQSLQRVWDRLEQERRQQQAPDTARTAPIALSQRKQAMKNILPSAKTSHTSHRIRGTLSLLVATLVIAVTVGSAVFVFDLASKNNHSKTTINSPGIYITYLSDLSHEVVSKVDLQTHKQLWIYTGATIHSGTPTVSGNRVYLNTHNLTTSQADVIALDANTGKVLWDVPFKVDSTMDGQFKSLLVRLTPPVVVGGQVYVMNGVGTVFSLDAATGKRNWTYHSGASTLVNGSPYNGGEPDNGGKPVVSDGILYSAQHNIYFAVDAKTGKQLWSHTIDIKDQALASVQFLNGAIYTFTYPIIVNRPLPQSYVYAFNAKDGTQLWKYPVQLIGVNINRFGVANGYIYFIQESSSPGITSSLYALNIRGKEVWHKDYSSDGVSQLVVGDGYVSVSEANWSPVDPNPFTSYTLHVYNATNGKVIWDKSVEADPVSLQNGILYALTRSRVIIAYDLASKKELWQRQYGVDLINAPVRYPVILYTVVIIP